MKHYVIKHGDTLSQIAQSFAIPLKVLLFANPEVTNPDFIKVDQVIRIPEVVK